jgi:signal transduction histidine kinase
MGIVPKWYRHFCAVEDGYVDMLDALDAGRDPPPRWRVGPYARIAQTVRCLSTVERRQLRDFVWRYRGWRGLSVLGLAIAINCTIGWFISAGTSTGWFDRVEAMFLVNLGVLGLASGFIGIWFDQRQLRRLKGRAFIILPIYIFVASLVGGVVTGIVMGKSPASVVGKASVAGLILGFAITTVLALIATVRNRELAALNAQLAAEGAQQRLAGEVTASRLRLLRAQIEPHFLFNTLGAVQQLAEGRAPDAAALTAHLIRFLRDSVGGFDDATTTLGHEVTIVASYLEIMKTRLGARLSYAIDVPDALRSCPIQPTMLLNFVENAIKHGIEAAPRGGTIRLGASASDAMLTIEVADTGVGMADTIGDGHGLRNAREQLALAYDGRATLELVENEPSGLIVRLCIPRDATQES